ncbi:MAG: hypothetical protein L6Q95_19305, partial [Planctomycetes bacterium]|nr:hypothetical protein [Planctomycetota bacterium]
TALLTADVPDDPPVRLNAILALANLGDPNATGPLLGFFGAASGAPKAAAGMAVASLGRQNPIVLDDAAFQVLLAGTRDGDAAVRAAAFAALGACQLSADQALACAVANRPTVGAPEGGGEGGGAGGGEEGGEESTEDGATLSTR